MRNIFLIPTDKPSRLCIDNSCNELNYSDIEGYNSKHITNQNIYITSDEKIKEGDWYLDLSVFTNNISIGRGIYQMKYSKWGEEGQGDCKKIILTNDSTLIADGIQAIDDKFLEWFIKNPSCEFVEIKKVFEEHKTFDISYYKIIFPQEETKCYHVNTYTEYLGSDEAKKEAVEKGYAFYKKEETKTNLERLPFPELVKEFAEYYKKVPLVEETKQETIEEPDKWSLDNAKEFALNYFKKSDEVPSKGMFTYELLLRILEAGIECGYKFGIKRQDEKRYTYDELRQIAYNAYCLGQLEEPTENKYNLWIQQFKKK
jgi:hypothetical protein